MEIGVIGGGASAVCLIDALAQAAVPPGGITIFEPSGQLWRGRPYQQDLSAVRVNAPPEDMSVRQGDLGHFRRWLDAKAAGGGRAYPPDPWSETRFVPRHHYGDYLEDSARQGLARLRRQGWRVSLVPAAVTALVRTADRAVLRTAHGQHRAFDYAVLCVGGGRPQDIYGLAGSPGYIGEPYPLMRSMMDIRPRQHVAIIGSGLTAVDVVMALASGNHRGRISLLSRNGVLPGVRQRQVDYHLRYFTQDQLRAWALRQDTVTLDDIVRLMRTELSEAGEDITGLLAEIGGVRDEEPVARLRRHFDSVDSPHLGLRILQRAVPDTGPDVWPLLSEREKATILSEHYRTIMSLCCPMPPSSAQTLLHLIDSGRLEIISGVKAVEPTRTGFQITSSGGGFGADVVVNAVSAPRHKVPDGAAPLISSLLATRAATRHHHGGLHIERETSRLTVDGEPDPRLYALGDLAAGSLFFTFGIPSLVDRAVDIVQAIRKDVTVAPNVWARAAA